MNDTSSSNGSTDEDEVINNFEAYLKLKNPNLYTGHCLRRTAATLLSNSGASTTMLKQLGGWKSTGIAEGYVENSLTNRQRVFDSITHAGTSNTQSNPQPSTSRNNAADIKDLDGNEVSTQMDNEDNFSDNFEIDNDLTAIEKSALSKCSKSPMPLLAGTKDVKVVLTSNRQARRPTHFTNKTPVSVFSRKKENEPPKKKEKVRKTDAQTNNQALESEFIDTATNRKLAITFVNCVFHGNVINSFYCSTNNSDKNHEKKIGDN